MITDRLEGDNMLNSLQTMRYQVRHPMLKSLIKYYWVIETQSPVEINHKLLPVSNIDFILNLSSQISYLRDEKIKIMPNNFHFSGVSEKYYTINQSGILKVLGISFYSIGLFPILKIPISEFKNNTMGVDFILKGFTENIMNKINVTDSIPTIINIIETEILKVVDFSLIPSKEIYEVFLLFNKNINDLNISDFCKKYGVNQRQIERLFNKYIGTSPKLFYRINRFQEITKHLKKGDDVDLTSLAYNNCYYDQTHFIKDFKAFTGSTPTEFLNKNTSIKQIIKYN